MRTLFSRVNIIRFLFSVNDETLEDVGIEKP